MSHSINYRTFNSNVSKENITNTICHMVSLSGDGYGTDHISFTDRIFNDEDAAHEYLNSKAGSFYEGYAAMFYDYSHVPSSSKIKELNEKISEFVSRRKVYIEENSVKKQKAAYIGCPKCGSKLKRELIFANSCPLCHTELRSKTTLDRISSFDARIAACHQKIKEERKKDQKKAEVKWLVKYEYHC